MSTKAFSKCTWLYPPNKHSYLHMNPKFKIPSIQLFFHQKLWTFNSKLDIVSWSSNYKRGNIIKFRAISRRINVILTDSSHSNPLNWTITGFTERNHRIPAVLQQPPRTPGVSAQRANSSDGFLSAKVGLLSPQFTLLRLLQANEDVTNCKIY